MISQKHKKTLLQQQFISETLSHSGSDIFKRNAEIANSFLNKRTGNLQSHLNKAPFSVSKVGAGAVLSLEYLKYTRFVEMKKTATGKRKRNFVALYSKVFYGYIYGWTYNELRYGLTGAVRERLTVELSKIYSNNRM